ncbi:MAG: cyclic nucleotide-binding domain-containing protein [Proteobacteria bacterium]|nr:cyclic nucleotide-binding domain-containing protein [Pseudomonadota bacterium]
MKSSKSFDFVDYLKTHSIFRGMSEEQIKTLAASASVRQYEPGACLFKQGESADHCYIVVSGRVSVEIPSIYGPPLIVQTIADEGVLGWSWLIPPYQWAFEAIAQNPTEVIEFDGAALRNACESDPALGYQLMKRFAGLMSQRLHEAREKMMENWSAPGFA